MLNDDYSPKAAFAVYRELVANLGQARDQHHTAKRASRVVQRVAGRGRKKLGFRRQQD